MTLSPDAPSAQGQRGALLMEEALRAATRT
jgi:hypothetical protein